MKTFKAFFKFNLTYVGIGIAFAFLLIFFTVWLTAYHGVTDRIDQLKVGIVNDDITFHTVMLTDQLPFTMVTMDQASAGVEKLNKRELDMLIVVPRDFTEHLATSTAIIEFYINQAGPALSKQVMESTANEIVYKINEQAFTMKKEQLTSAPEPFLRDGVQALSLEGVQSKIIKLNHTEGFAASMIPLLVVLASFVGSMLMSLNLFQATKQLAESYSKWSILFTRFVIQFVVSVLLSALTMSLLLLFGFKLHVSLWEGFVFQVFVYLSFLCLTQMFTVLFGMAGMLLNIVSLSIQLVTAGVIVPRALLSDFYQLLSLLFPATYGASGYFSIIYGGMNVAGEIKILTCIIVITFGATLLKVALSRENMTA
ncbi:YhgE/Pip domain-containing protein [Paenibacillus septentrionalis]|uniref:YhgE/Pip domain-containing protein n=1 Tax=Paenibacillus septentrionalis TaxID=429342 RepID=A0ABW1V5X5_9BACL